MNEFNDTAPIYLQIMDIIKKRIIAEKRRGMGTFISENAVVIENVRNEVSHKLVSDFVSGMDECGFSAADIIALVQKHIEMRTEQQENV